jgi:hypothetical protein
MLQEELHKLIDDLAWEDVETIAEEDANIATHLRDCKACQERVRRIDDGRLASMGAKKRQIILKAAGGLADIFMNKHEA